MPSHFASGHPIQKMWYNEKHPVCYLLFLPWSKGKGVKKGYLGMRRDQSSGLCLTLGLIAGENLAVAVEGEAIQYSNKSGTQCSHFKFKKFLVTCVMLASTMVFHNTSTMVFHNTCKGIDQDAPWSALPESPAWHSSHPTAPASSAAMGWSQGHPLGPRHSHSLWHRRSTAWLIVSLHVRGRETHSQDLCRVGEGGRHSREVGGRGRTAADGSGEPSCTLPLLPVTWHPLARGDSSSWSPSPAWWQTQSNWVIFPHSDQLHPTSAYWWSEVVQE